MIPARSRHFQLARCSDLLATANNCGATALEKVFQHQLDDNGGVVTQKGCGPLVYKTHLVGSVCVCGGLKLYRKAKKFAHFKTKSTFVCGRLALQAGEDNGVQDGERVGTERGRGQDVIRLNEMVFTRDPLDKLANHKE